MIVLTNRFHIVGTLIETRVDLYAYHFRAKFSINVNEEVYTVYYSANKKFKEEKYNALIDMIPCLHGKIDGYVWANENRYYTIRHNEPTTIYFSGNLIEKNGLVFYNASYMRVVPKQNGYVNIEIAGYKTQKGLLNIFCDTPRLFVVDSTKWEYGRLYRVKLEPLQDYSFNNEIIYMKNNEGNFNILTSYICDSTMSEEEINNWLLEWEIVNGEKQ